jgi:hypothetical protein
MHDGKVVFFSVRLYDSFYKLLIKPSINPDHGDSTSEMLVIIYQNACCNSVEDIFSPSLAGPQTSLTCIVFSLR